MPPFRWLQAWLVSFYRTLMILLPTSRVFFFPSEFMKVAIFLAFYSARFAIRLDLPAPTSMEAWLIHKE
jgi:hypothetical protein